MSRLDDHKVDLYRTGGTGPIDGAEQQPIARGLTCAIGDSSLTSPTFRGSGVLLSDAMGMEAMMVARGQPTLTKLLQSGVIVQVTHQKNSKSRRWVQVDGAPPKYVVTGVARRHGATEHVQAALRPG